MAQEGLLRPEHFRVVVNCVADGVLTVDQSWTITFFNAAAEQITGIPASEAVGKSCSEVLHADMCAEHCALRHTMLTGKPVIGRQVTIERRDGRRIPISVSTALLRDDDGEVIGGVETFRDLSQVEELRRKFLNRHTISNIVARSRKMRELLDLLPRFAATETTCMISGDSGTGKELLARAIHKMSDRSRGPFVAVNCGALPDTLLESELFGHEAGAFTDAKKPRQGRFALAEGGTIFLDEVGDVSPALQARLLRVLQEREYQPLGSEKVLKSDARVVAATNRNLEEMVAQGEFRSDLFYRLNVVSLQLPPLCQRLDDVPLLSEHFISRYARIRGKHVSGLSEEVLAIFMNHSWPGNVRELENAIEYAFILCPGGLVQPEHLPEHLRQDPNLPSCRGGSSLADIEQRVILQALRRNQGHRATTARELGISTTTLWRKLKRIKSCEEDVSN